MSLLPTCTVCDALLKGYSGRTRCERCQQPCPECGGDVAHCSHPLTVLDLEAKPIGNGRFQVAA